TSSPLTIFYIHRPPPPSTLFPYTTLFRSARAAGNPSTPNSPKSASSQGRSARQVGTWGRKKCAQGLVVLLKTKTTTTTTTTTKRSEEHTSELQSLRHLVCRLLLEKKNRKK